MAGRKYDFDGEVKKLVFLRQKKVCASCGKRYSLFEGQAAFHHLIPDHLGVKMNKQIKDNNFDLFLRSERNCVMLCDLRDSWEDNCHDVAHDFNTQRGALSAPVMFKFSHGPDGIDSPERRSWIRKVNRYWHMMLLSSKTGSSH